MTNLQLTFKGISLKINPKRGCMPVLEWVDWAYEQVLALARTDRDYRELTEEQRQAADEFEKVLGCLSEQDREAVLEYLNLSIDMQYRQTQVAYEFGKLVGRNQKQIRAEEEKNPGPLW